MKFVVTDFAKSLHQENRRLHLQVVTTVNANESMISARNMRSQGNIEGELPSLTRS